jgi:hypothetical protein
MRNDARNIRKLVNFSSDKRKEKFFRLRRAASGLRETFEKKGFQAFKKNFSFGI